MQSFRYPVVCMAESPQQLIAETRIYIPVSPGQPAKYDYKYRHVGVFNIFMACEPLAEKRMVKVTERKTNRDWACFLDKIGRYIETNEDLRKARCKLVSITSIGKVSAIGLLALFNTYKAINQNLCTTPY